MLVPLLAGVFFSTLPTKLDFPSLHCASDEWTACPHSILALAAATLALAHGMVTRTKPAGKTTDSEFRIRDLHYYSSV